MHKLSSQPTWWSNKVAKQNVGPILFTVIVQDDKEKDFSALRPEWLENANQIAQDYRKKLEDKCVAWDEEAIKEMKFFEWKFSYNKNWTVNLLKLDWGKTFCADLTGKWNAMTRKRTKSFVEKKWYRLLTDWNEDDSTEKRKDTDWYKLLEYFWSYAHESAFRCMLGCDIGWYRTATPYTNPDIARSRRLYELDVYREWHYMDYEFFVCGRKPMAA